MTQDRGSISKRQKLRDWPHHVYISVPAGGLRARANEMHEFCREIGADFQTASTYGPGKPDGVMFCFKSKKHANAFAARYASNASAG